LWGFPITSAVFGPDQNRQASSYEYADGGPGNASNWSYRPGPPFHDVRDAAAAAGLIIAAAITFYAAILALDLLALIVTAPHDIYWLIKYRDPHSRWGAYMAEGR
ncbi:MAG: hypothetical protein ACYTGX_12295, partial [Planctomycetota bacterium]